MGKSMESLRRYIADERFATHSDLHKIAHLACEMREFIRYWSYCTRMGMNQYCPEKRNAWTEQMRAFGLTETEDDDE